MTFLIILVCIKVTWWALDEYLAWQWAEQEYARIYSKWAALYLWHEMRKRDVTSPDPTGESL